VTWHNTQLVQRSLYFYNLLFLFGPQHSTARLIFLFTDGIPLYLPQISPLQKCQNCPIGATFIDSTSFPFLSSFPDNFCIQETSFQANKKKGLCQDLGAAKVFGPLDKCVNTS
jgi:hypothetical protein